MAMSEPLPLFPETYGFVPLLEKVEAMVMDDMARAEAARPGVLAESRSLDSAWENAPGETATGRVTDGRA
jgi:hypothetical protein